MLDQMYVEKRSDVQITNGRLLPFISNCYRSALQKLNDAFRADRPAAILVSKGRWAPSHVLDSFQSGLGDEAVVARIDQSCADATSFMRQIIRSIGFDSEGMGLADLEKVLELFLQHQRKHKRRTIIAIQYSDNHGWWVLDTVRRLVEKEAEANHGLMVILAGPPNVITALNDPIMDVINSQAGERIVLTPFSLSETRDYVRQRVADISTSDGSSGDVGRVFEFDSVSLIHELCSGVPDDVDKLCDTCLELIAGDEEKLVSIDVVKAAASLANLSTQLPDTAVDLPVLNAESEATKPGKLLVDSVGESLEEIDLAEDNILVGRDQLCGVCVAAAGISRFHGMILQAGRKVHYVDLNSTNGSCVNGDKVDRRSLQDNDVITIGTTRITYRAAEEPLSPAVKCDTDDKDESPVQDQDLSSPITRLSRDLNLLRTS